MILVAHIIVAVLGVIQAAAVFIKPSPAKFQAAYSLVGLTFLSGTYLVTVNPGHLASACLSGIMYLGIVSAMLLAGRQKLAKMPVRVRSRRSR